MGLKEKVEKDITDLQDLLVKAVEILPKNDTMAFNLLYQEWLTRAIKILKAFAPDRLEEFQGYYYRPVRPVMNWHNYCIQDFIENLGAPTDSTGKRKFNTIDVVARKLSLQNAILKSSLARVDDIIGDLQFSVFAELQDEQLAACQELMPISLRAAGALAGVILESHLQKLAQKHSIAIAKKSPTVSDLNDPLKAAGIYDVATWRRIQFLADIRNICSHQKGREPTEAEVNDLLAGVNYVVKNV